MCQIARALDVDELGAHFVVGQPDLGDAGLESGDQDRGGIVAESSRRGARVSSWVRRLSPGMAARTDSQPEHVQPAATISARSRTHAVTLLGLDSSNIFKTPSAREATFGDTAPGVSAFPAARTVPACVVRAKSAGGMEAEVSRARSVARAAPVTA